MTARKIKRMTLDEWRAKGEALYGKYEGAWKFRCPSCGHVATPEDYRPFKNNGATPDSATFNCIGRYDGRHGHVRIGTRPGPCNYTSGGLFNLCTLEVVGPSGRAQPAFEFADDTVPEVRA